jgi:IS4 transposase
MDKNLLDLYSYYLLSSFGPTTATDLSSLLDGEVSHDQVTRFLSGDAYTSKTLWQHIKSTLRSVERDEGVLIFDDTIQAKPHTDENELICWHFDHTENRSVKGIDLLNCVYQIDDLTIPVAFELVRKPLLFSDPETGQTKRKSEETKNELLRSMLQTCQHNQIKYRYILADSWFSAKDNLTFIRHRLDKHFIVALKSNRTGALSKEDKLQGRVSRIDALPWSEETPVLGWIKGLDFQVFTNKDGSTGSLYLACSDFDLQALDIETIYQKRWRVEVFHKTLKSDAALAKSPQAGTNPEQPCLYAAFRVECLRIKHGWKNHALKTKLYMKAIRSAFEQLQKLKTA